jgi:hypothetical protein
MGSAAGVLLVLTLLLAAYRQRECDCAIELVLDGRERIPIAAVARQRRRLLSDRTRQGLASSLEDKLRQASDRHVCRARIMPVPFEPVVVSTVAGEMVEVISLLRDSCACARGVALAERLVEHALSPLYGREVDALRAELCRVRDVLKAEAPCAGVASIGAGTADSARLNDEQRINRLEPEVDGAPPTATKPPPLDGSASSDGN